MASSKVDWTLERRQKLSNAHRGKRLTNEHKAKIGLSNKGKVVSDDTKAKISASSKGKKMSKEMREKMAVLKTGRKASIETRRKMSLAHKGKKSHLWEGGLTEINTAVRHSIDYRLWREAVFQRDNYTCVWCNQRGGRLNADHIKPFSAYPELRFAIDNGRTMCVGCHRKTDTYGRPKSVQNKIKEILK